MLLARAVAAVALVAAAAACAARPPVATAPGLQAAMRGHTHTVTSLALSRDGATLVSGSRDGTARVWSAPTASPVAVLAPGRWRPATWAVALSPDGRLVASASDDFTVRIWDPAHRRPRIVLEGHTESIRVLAWSPDGRLFASGGRDTTVRLWETERWAPVATLKHGNTVRGLAFSPDGRRLFTGTADDVVFVWDVPARRLLGLLRGHDNTVHALAVSPDGATLVSGAADRALRLWSARTLEPQAVLRLDRAGEPVGRWERHGIDPGPEVLAVAVSPHGRVVASAHRDSAIRLWSLASGRELGRIHSPAGTSYALVFAPDGRTLFSGGDDDVIYRWDVPAAMSARH